MVLVNNKVMDSPQHANQNVVLLCLKLVPFSLYTKKKEFFHLQ